MQQGSREIGICHLHSVIKGPQSCPKTITETGETPTRRSVGLEHQEFFPFGHSVLSRIQIRRDDCLSGAVVEEVWKLVLRSSWSAGTELGKTIIGWVAGEMYQWSLYARERWYMRTVPRPRKPNWHYMYRRNPYPRFAPESSRQSPGWGR